MQYIVRRLAFHPHFDKNGRSVLPACIRPLSVEGGSIMAIVKYLQQRCVRNFSGIIIYLNRFCMIGVSGGDLIVACIVCRTSAVS